ncbi:MAG: methyltransferase domain-containing protein, partial [Gemmatimonadetes bacterium]|nr:methyltransferase domain-containing protein [Gemmatimonadota bacterium]
SSDLRWWEERARRHGARAVYNSGHAAEDLPLIDQKQKEILYPILQSRLNGDERVILDFGCGPGRFTPDLAQLVRGRAIGVDPIQSLLDAAPRTEATEYRLVRHGCLPLQDDSVDVVWICLVLTCIVDARAVREAVAEVERVLRPGGLVFLVENTAAKKDMRHIAFRSIDDYRALFAFAPLRHERDYEDRGEPISILCGRKRGASASG